MAVSVGGDWAYELYFSKEMKDPNKFHTFGNDDLATRFREVTGEAEKILSIQAFKCPLASAQLTSFKMYHSFIVLETAKWWWSIEKRGAGILIQRSRAIERVKHFRVEEGTVKEMFRSFPIKSCLKDMSCKPTWDLIDQLCERDELNKKYDFFARNCKSFAKRTFNNLAKSKKLRFYHSAFA